MINRFIIQFLCLRKACCTAFAAILFTAFAMPLQGAMILVDFGPNNDDDGRATSSPDSNGNFWNNWRPRPGYNNSVAQVIAVGTMSPTLVDTMNISTGITLEITDDFLSNGRVNGGLLSPSAVLLGDFAVDTATEDYFYVASSAIGSSTPNTGSFKLTGLDTNLTYDFSFFGTRQTTETRITTYTATGANGPFSVDLTTSGTGIGTGGYNGNNDTIVSLSGLQPNALGEIEIGAVLNTGPFGYLGIMQVTSSAAAVPEPSTFLMTVMGLISLVYWCRRQ